MNEKNIPDDIDSKSLNELTELANKIIEKKFHANTKEISKKTIFQIKEIKQKNEKKTK